MKFTKEDIELIEKFIEIKRKGFYADGGQVTQVYNRVLEKSVNPTNCGSCIRGRVQELEDALNNFKRLAKEQEEAEANNDTPEQNNEPVEEKKKVGRPKKS
jgi:hypothetical protein